MSDEQIEGALVDLLVVWRGARDRLDLAGRIRVLLPLLGPHDDSGERPGGAA